MVRIGHWIQVSGASILSIPDIVNGTYGEACDKVYGDIDNAQEIRDIVKQNAAKRAVDNYLLNQVTGTKTALVFPPIIYGQGRGPIKQRSVQIPELARVASETRHSVQVGKGESTWSNVHVADVTDVFVKLIEKAVEGADGDLWNQDGLYFVGNGQMVRRSESPGITTADPRRASVESRSWLLMLHTSLVSLTRLLSRVSVQVRQRPCGVLPAYSGVPMLARTHSERDSYLHGSHAVTQSRKRFR